jgi:hypothetical protein
MRTATRWAVTGWLFAVPMACGGSENPAASPASVSSTSPLTPAAEPLAAAATPPTAPAAAAGDLLGQLKTRKLELADGIQRVAVENGPAISAKFELEDGKLQLSIYTAQGGLEKDAEQNVLLELAGDAAAAKWEPKREVFEDKEHITRAATHLTLVQLAKTNLPAVIAKATAQQPGTVYAITPVVKNRKPAFDVLVATPEGKSVQLTIPGG